MKKIVIRPV